MPADKNPILNFLTQTYLAAGLSFLLALVSCMVTPWCLPWLAVFPPTWLAVLWFFHK